MDMEFRDLVARCGIISICRRLYGQGLYLLSDVLAEADILLMEVTFDQEDPRGREKTAEAIAALHRRHPEMRIGAGTVLTCEEARLVREAGGSFIVSPNTDSEVIGCAKTLGLAAVPGAMTPSEVAAAAKAGADVVKLFPADHLGPAYVRELRAPLGHIPLLATGGITAQNLADFLAAGCIGAGIGGALCDKALLAAGDRTALLERARALRSIVAQYR